MSHSLELVDGKAQMAYRKSAGVPWHNLGTPVGDNLTPQEIMKVAGLDWEVKKVDNYARLEHDDGTFEYIPTETKALLRSTDNRVLTEVGKNWNPVQNKEAFDFFSEFVEAGDMRMDTAGSLHNGRIVWALADLKDGFTLFGGDEVKGYLLFSNPHIYGQTVDVKFVATRVVCQNRLIAALNEKGQPSVKVNHRAKFDAEKVKQVLGVSRNKLETFKEAAEILGSKKYVKSDLEKYYGTLFGQSTKEDKLLSRTAERALNIVETQPGAEFAPGSFWNMFNAISFMTDHRMGRSEDTRMTSALFGANAKKKNHALELALQMAL